jgi:hypothetical protein
MQARVQKFIENSPEITKIILLLVDANKAKSYKASQIIHSFLNASMDVQNYDELLKAIPASVAKEIYAKDINNNLIPDFMKNAFPIITDTNIAKSLHDLFTTLYKKVVRKTQQVEKYALFTYLSDPFLKDIKKACNHERKYNENSDENPGYNTINTNASIISKIDEATSLGDLLDRLNKLSFQHHEGFPVSQFAISPKEKLKILRNNLQKTMENLGISFEDQQHKQTPKLDSPSLPR